MPIIVFLFIHSLPSATDSPIWKKKRWRMAHYVLGIKWIVYLMCGIDDYIVQLPIANWWIKSTWVIELAKLLLMMMVVVKYHISNWSHVLCVVALFLLLVKTIIIFICGHRATNLALGSRLFFGQKSAAPKTYIRNNTTNKCTFFCDAMTILEIIARL